MAHVPQPRSESEPVGELVVQAPFVLACGERFPAPPFSGVRLRWTKSPSPISACFLPKQGFGASLTTWLPDEVASAPPMTL